MKDFFRTIAERIPPKDILKAVKYMLAGGLAVVGVTCLCGYDLQIGKGELSFHKHNS